MALDETSCCVLFPEYISHDPVSLPEAGTGVGRSASKFLRVPHLSVLSAFSNSGFLWIPEVGSEEWRSQGTFPGISLGWFPSDVPLPRSFGLNSVVVEDQGKNEWTPLGGGPCARQVRWC